MWWLLTGCAEAPKPCGLEECAAFIQVPEEVAGPLAPWEQALVAPLLTDARAGIRPWNDTAIGLCRGSRTCEAFVGADPGELPPGDYVLRAELRVPELGPPGTWTVVFRSRCEITTRTKDGGTRTKTQENALEQAVLYAGPSEGWRLEPLQRIASPSDGAASCAWTLVAHGPTGERGWEGAWRTPDRAPAEAVSAP